MGARGVEQRRDCFKVYFRTRPLRRHSAPLITTDRELFSLWMALWTCPGRQGASTQHSPGLQPAGGKLRRLTLGLGLQEARIVLGGGLTLTHSFQ